MFYENTLVGTFLSRPNRFLAHVMVDGREVVCHVKNTGRLRELLLPGAPVVLQHHPDSAAAGRKTEYSLIGVAKPIRVGAERRGNFVSSKQLAEALGNSVEAWIILAQAHGGFGEPKEFAYTWVNIDSQAPNQVACEWLKEGEGLPFCPRSQNVRREVKYGQSRFDLAFEDSGKPWLMEVKGVTLDVNGTAMFPDAPTERGVKHIAELADAAEHGFGAAVLFVIQMKGITAFAPHAERHPAFAEALRDAKKRGVKVWAYDCVVTENSLKIDAPVKVTL